MNQVVRNLTAKLNDYAGFFPVVAVLGPRQCGKTTLARDWIRTCPKALYLDLERPSDLAKLTDPEDFLTRHSEKLVCLDEIQRAPELFPVLRSLSDETGRPGQFLLLGSASPDLLRQTSETLAGRIGYLELTPFRESEIGSDKQKELWLRGGFPRSYLAPSGALSRAWLESFVTTFLERDIPQLGLRIPAPALRKFWQMCAHLHGDIWNHSKIASSLGVTGKTTAHYLDILEASFMLRRLLPYQANIKKRLVKSPRVYLRDTGVLHHLLGLRDHDALDAHPVKGASWESYVIEQVAAAVPGAELSFYRTAAGAEIDLIVRHNNQTTAIEIKSHSAPKLQRGFWTALDDIAPDNTWVAAPVSAPFSLGQNIEVAPPHVICKALDNEQTRQPAPLSSK